MIVLINPNSTVAMTEAMGGTALGVLGDVPFEGWTSHGGPPSIQGVEDGIAAHVPLLAEVQRASDAGAGAIIIGCFDDTGLADAQQIAACPVIGIGQAAYHMAAMSGRKFSVVTTLDVSVPILEANIETYGLKQNCSAVRASGVEVLALEHDPEGAAQGVLEEVQRAEREDGIDTVVLGCGGMVRLPELVREQTGLRPIDGVRAAAWVAQGLVSNH